MRVGLIQDLEPVVMKTMQCTFIKPIILRLRLLTQPTLRTNGFVVLSLRSS